MRSRHESAHRNFRRWPWLLLAWGSLIAGIIGVFLPILPTVPFILLAAWAASRGSRSMRAWLLRHRVFGKSIREWERSGHVSRRAKWLATVTMSAGAVVAAVVLPGIVFAMIVWAVMLTVGIWLWRRPEPARSRQTASS